MVLALEHCLIAYLDTRAGKGANCLSQVIVAQSLSRVLVVGRSIKPREGAGDKRNP